MRITVKFVAIRKGTKNALKITEELKITNI